MIIIIIIVIIIIIIIIIIISAANIHLLPFASMVWLWSAAAVAKEKTQIQQCTAACGLG